MKKASFFSALMILSVVSIAQSYADTAKQYFEELAIVTHSKRSLWDRDLYGPLLLVDPSTREVYSNYPDSAGVLQKTGEIYFGKLPASVNISNTSVQWSGVRWAMVMRPLPMDRNNRLNLLSHELFHRIQKELGFIPHNPDNNHLDKKDGRIYLRLELEALKKAMVAATPKETNRHLRHALLFRIHRQSLYGKADSTENLLELNEGICEYTGEMYSDRSKVQFRNNFLKRIDFFIQSPSYVRSFAYETIPVYGYLLALTQPGWHRTINGTTNLTSFFQKAFSVRFPIDMAKEIASTRDTYNYSAIIREETSREERIAKQIMEYRNKLVDSPHVELPLINMNMSFDYTRMMPLEKLGTVYPQIRITDKWGILDVTKGALIGSNWNKVNVSYPTKIEANQISGDGWQLELKSDYKLVRDSLNNYRVVER